MAAIRSAEADRFIARRDPSIFLYLVHGSDTGLVHERARALVARAIADPKDPFQLARIDGDELARDPGRLADEANQIGLLGGSRAIWIEAGAKSMLPALEALIAAPPTDCAVIVEAGALKKSAPLRALVERTARAAALECHGDDPGTLDALIDGETKAAGVAIDPAAKRILRDLLGDDRMTTRAELGKLMLYVHGRDRITTEDIEAIVADAAALALDTVIDAAFLGDRPTIETQARRAFADGTDAGYLIGTALRHAMLLHRTRLEIDAGRPTVEAIGAAKRQIYNFRRQAAFGKQVESWTTAKLARVIDVLSDAVGKARRETRLGELIAVRALWTVAQGAGAPVTPRRSSV